MGKPNSSDILPPAPRVSAPPDCYEFAMSLRFTHGDESTQFQDSLIPNRLGRDFRRSVLPMFFEISIVSNPVIGEASLPNFFVLAEFDPERV
jgi:hypothetical protein